MDKYLLNLFNQFCDARGIVCNSSDFYKHINEFIDWMKYNKMIIENYKEFLLYLGYINGKTISEVGKGKYDSLYLANSEIISPYADTIGLPNSELLIIGSYPFIHQNGNIVRPDTEVLLTHNPYDEMRVLNWYKIHNSNMYDVSIGMYGNIHDSNFSERIKLLEKISKRMQEDYAVDYETDQDNYFCSINSKGMIKEIKRILSL